MKSIKRLLGLLLVLIVFALIFSYLNSSYSSETFGLIANLTGAGAILVFLVLVFKVSELIVKKFKRK